MFLCLIVATFIPQPAFLGAREASVTPAHPSSIQNVSFVSTGATGSRFASLGEGTGFVKRDGAQLLLNGSPFRFSGMNIYWLSLDENVGGTSYPSHFRVNDALDTARKMGATVVRSHMLISTGCQLCIKPSLSEINETALRYVDYAVKAAGERGIRLILPLTDNYHYYHGGKYHWTTWRGLDDEEQFYTSEIVIKDFEQYINLILNRVNTYTGIAYKDDPTILAWETGNELHGPAQWTGRIATYIKSIDPSHLVVNGQGGATPEELALPNVDLYTAHFYPPNIHEMTSIATAVAAAQKVFFVGEYDWTGKTGGDPLSSFLAAIEASPTAGDLFWHLLGHGDQYGWVYHSEAYYLHYPGLTVDQRGRAAALRAHAYRIRGSIEPAPTGPVPPIVTVAGKYVAWRGTAGADHYSIERSTQGPSGPWSVICDHCASDADTPWQDLSSPQTTVWYRVRGYSPENIPSAYSAPVRRAAPWESLVLHDLLTKGTPNQLEVSGFSLINVDTGKPVPGYAWLGDGVTIDPETLPTRALALGANIASSGVGSIQFILDDQRSIENTAPFAVGGDIDGRYNRLSLSPGLHTLTAIPYDSADAGGTAGIPLTISFTIVEQE